METRKRNILVALTGASGSIYARLLCERLSQDPGVGELALVSTRNGEAVAAFEEGTAWMEDPRLTRYANDDLFAPPASGSAPYDAMAIIPCSMGMAGRLAGGISNDLVSRAADVMLKERRPLVLVIRESPLSTIHLRNLTTLSESGALVCPASPSFYAHPGDIPSLCGSVVERVVAHLGSALPGYRWQGGK